MFQQWVIFLMSYYSSCVYILLFHYIPYCNLNMSHFSYLHKMRCPLNLVLENWEYLRFYCTFWIVILDGSLKPHKLLIHASERTRNKLNHCLTFPLHCISCHICYRKILEKNFSTVIKDKLLVSKASNSCFKGLDFFQMLLASHR